MECCLHCLESRLRELTKRNKGVVLQWHKVYNKDSKCQSDYITPIGRPCTKVACVKVETLDKS